MVSSRGRPLSPETKKAVVSVKQYFDGKKFQPIEPSVKRTADALGKGKRGIIEHPVIKHFDPKSIWTSPMSTRITARILFVIQGKMTLGYRNQQAKVSG